METCSFCLGDENDVPPFGSVDDAKDLIHPCTTCKITTHRKCLLDWFNSLTSDKLQIIKTDEISSFLQRNNSNDDNSTTENAESRIFSLDEIEIGQSPSTTRIHINLSPQQINEWFNNFTNVENYTFKDNVVFLLASCPQCKEDIIFSMKRSTFLSINSGFRSFISKAAQYSTVFLGFTSAVTGVVSMGYIGLTSVGLKTMDCILPESFLIKLLIKSKTSGNLLSSIFQQSNYPIDNLESALLKGLIDPFKFSRIPLLPIILYRMRQSSPISCLYSKDVSSWLTELMINGYISSLGDHKFLSSVYYNLLSSITRMLKNPLKFWKYFNLFKGIDFNDANNLISLFLPARILYDIFFRMTLNQLHFDITMNVKPREIANKLTQEQLDELEMLYGELNTLKLSLMKKPFQVTNWQDWFLEKKLYITKLFKSNAIWKILKLKSLIFLKRMKYCIKHDFSQTLSYSSFTIRCLTTVVWPFLSSKLGQIIFNSLNATENKDKKLFLCNLAGMVLVVLLKDLTNLYLSSKKSEQLKKLKIHNFERDNSNNNTFSIPGDYI